MKLFFTLIAVALTVGNAYPQQVANQVNLIVPHKNIKASAKMQVVINDNRFLMKEGSYVVMPLYSDSAQIAFCSDDWKTKKRNTIIPLDKDIFVVAYFDETSTSTYKYFFREIRLEEFNYLRKKCKRQITILY